MSKLPDDLTKIIDKIKDKGRALWTEYADKQKTKKAYKSIKVIKSIPAAPTHKGKDQLKEKQ